MKISNITRVWFFLALMIILTACGGSGGGDTKKVFNPIDKITNYANNSSSGAPTLDDYEKAGIKGVTISNIAKINTAIHAQPTNSVDTASEIQSIVNETAKVPETGELTEDYNAPEIMLRGSNYVQLNQNESYEEKGALAIDAKDGKLNVVIGGDVVDTTKVGTYIVTYIATDKAGNKVTETRIVTVVLPSDTTKPVITLKGNPDLILAQDTNYAEAGAIANDLRDGVVHVVITGSVDTSKVGTYTVTYTATDKAGNKATKMRTVTVVLPPDTIKPVITLKGASTITLTVGESYQEQGARAMDDRDGNLELNIHINGTVNTQVPGTYAITYSVSDVAGNSASVTRSVIVKAIVGPIDNVKPVITLKGNITRVVTLGSTYVDAGATAFDTVDGDISNKIAINSTVNTAVIGNYTVTYTVSDLAGNVADTVTRAVVVKAVLSPDNQAPVITLNGKETMLVVIGTAYSEPGYSAIDDRDGDISSAVKVIGSVNTAVIGTYVIKYAVEDSAGNGITKTRTVIVGDAGTQPIEGELVGNASNVTLKHIGPGGGGAAFGVGIHPSDADKILFSGDIGMLYRTENGGSNWTIVNAPTEVRSIHYDQKNPNNVWAAGTKVYKSEDAGKTWRALLGYAGQTIGAVGLDPTDSNIAYIAEGFPPRIAVGWVHGRVWKTLDGGNTWKSLNRPGGFYNDDSVKARNYSTIIVDPNSPIIAGEGHATVYMVGRGGVFRSDDAGANWQKLYFSDTGRVSDIVLVNKNGVSNLFLTVIPTKGLNDGGVYKSINKGNKWTPVNNGLDTLIGHLKRVNETVDTRMFSLLITHSKDDANRLYAGSWQGIYRSDDLGENWYEVTPKEGSYVKDRNGNYVGVLKDSNHFTKSLWGGIDNFQDFTVAQTDADTLSFTDNQDVYISKDGGITWTSPTFEYAEVFDTTTIPNLPASAPANRYTHKTRSNGIQNLFNVQMEVDPFDSTTYYGAYMDVGLEVSRDGANTWSHPTKGTPTRGHAWAVATDAKQEGRVYFSLSDGKIYRSNDKGKQWQEVFNDVTVGKIADIEVDRNNQNVYLATEKKGMYKSTDGGANWQHINGLPSFVRTISTHPVSSNIIYAGTESGIYVSTNNGQSWTQKGKGLFAKVTNISQSKSNPSTLYVTAHKPGQNGFWGERDLWKTTDGGEKWIKITPKFMRYSGAVLVNPYNENYIYACNYLFDVDQSRQKMVIVRSKDGGHTWENMTYNTAYNQGTYMTFDPKNPQHILVSTSFSAMEIIDNEAPKQ